MTQSARIEIDSIDNELTELMTRMELLEDGPQTPEVEREVGELHRRLDALLVAATRISSRISEHLGWDVA